MTNHYFSFGHSHAHSVCIDGERKTFDVDSLICIKAPDSGVARAFMVELFGMKWGFEYSDETLKMEYFPRGVIATVELQA